MDNKTEEEEPAASSQHDFFVSTTSGSMELGGMRAEVHSAKLSDFECLYRQPEDNSWSLLTLKELFIRSFQKFSVKKMLRRNFPTLGALNKYKVAQDLPSDIIAGLTAGITMIPQGMAFAALATLPPIVGLYISLFASITYFFLGSARQLSWGCVAVLSIMIANILDKYETTVLASLGVSAGCENVSPSVGMKPNILNTTEVESFSSIPNWVTAVTQFGMLENDSSVVPSTQKPEVVSIQRKMEVAGAVSVISGVILAVLGKLGLGKITSYMSDGLVTSFTVGVSVHVVSSQLKTVLGLSFPRQSGVFKLVKHWVEMLKNIHLTNLATVIISVLSMAIIYVVKRFINEKYKAKMRIPVPVELFVVITGTLITTFTKLSEKFGVSVVEDIPVGVPSPRMPDLSLGADYIVDGMVIIIISFTQTVAMAKLIGLKYNVKVDSDQEMFACGVVSVVCGIFSGYISGASVSRSLVQDSAGGKTQVASLFAAGLVLLVIMLIGPYFYYLPRCVLAAIVIINLRSVLLKILNIPDLWRKSRMDALVWIITLVATVILDADYGLLVGIICSLIFVLMYSQIASVDVLAQVPVSEHSSVWKPKDKYYNAKEISNIKVLRVNSPLYFVNAEIVTNLIFKKVGVNLPKKKAEELECKSAEERENDDKPVQGKNHAMMTENFSDERSVMLKEESNANPRRRLQSTESELENETNKHAIQNSGQQNYSSSDAGQKSYNSVALSSNSVALSSNSVAPSSNSVAPGAIPFSVIVLDLSGVSFIDLMGVSALEFLLSQFQTVGITVYISNVPEKCFETLHQCGFMKKHDSQVFLTTDAAVSQAVQS